VEYKKDQTQLPEQARVVIIGGGVIGCSIAYHLTKLGCRDVILLERRRLTCGTTWHAAGLLTSLRDTETQTKLARYTQGLYRRLESETGQATGLIECGSVQLALTDAKVEEMRRGYLAARCFGIECREISLAELHALWPLADVSDVKAAFHFPNDGRVNPADVTQALARGARTGGARLFEDTPITAVRAAGGRVTGVETPRGPVRAEYVVNCAGMWARGVGELAGVAVPLQAAEHYYLISEPVEGAHPQLPILRDPDRSAYIREEAGKIMVGLFEPIAKPWGMAGIPEDFTFSEIPPDWDRVGPYLEPAMRRVPVLLKTGVKLLFCGPEAFTPDHNYLMGEAPELRNFFVAAGFNSLGILSAGGAGFVMAHWIVEGRPPMDVWSVNIRRMQPWQNNSRYLHDRIVESLGIGYQDHWPYRQWETARGVKQGVLHDKLAAAGASFGESAGWERANWYASPGDAPANRYSWGRPPWFERQAAEHRAVRERVGLFDQSSFAKFLVQGRDAEGVLNRIATAECRVPDGRIIYTQFLNEGGGIEADLTVTRLDSDRFLVVTAAFTRTHVEAWIRERIPERARCVITDVSDAYSMLNLQGPASRELLQHVSDAHLSNDTWPFGTARELHIGYQTVLALRVTYVGELGWELYVPSPFTSKVYEALIGAGQRFGLQHCGYFALNSLRIEKAYREWAHDIGADDTPLEAGLAFTCAWNKPGGFIGREALLSKRADGVVRRRLVQFLLDDPGEFLVHKEPIYLNGEPNGFTTSGMYGHTLGAAVALGYVNCRSGVTEELIQGGNFEIDVAGRRIRARASLRPLYDSAGARIRA
jgi:glycine cleavage system aminomethyltransferase T/glycine/D-amino acid oxidase-like deaminating enzyme